MELRASSKCSAVANACLVAGQYSAVKITHVVDEAATEVVLRALPMERSRGTRLC